MISLNEITLGDKGLFDRYVGANEVKVSEMSFTNLFIWRKPYESRFAVVGGFLCVFHAGAAGEEYAMFPIADRPMGPDEHAEALAACLGELRGYFRGKGKVPLIRKADKDQVGLALSAAAGSAVSHDRDSGDYVYLSSDLIGLKGKRYDGKRNHMNKFKSLYDWEYVRMTPENAREAVAVLEGWVASRDEGDVGAGYERLANMELLESFGSLSCKGAFIKADGRYCAYTVGDVPKGDTAVIHVEKGDARYSGIYAMINQQFCENEWKDVAYINREQDMGNEGLRKAKLSYQPAAMVDKYDIRLI
ncbi:MAG: phosphatidylglycerol lysyltransferase domain-containing protein [Oscillospiraceae bacterium]|nr:phosphatidylglycerol lysyltransferase domain-containing protein [Oscillospiraceae bacterium]